MSEITAYARDNWESLVEQYDDLIGNEYVDENGEEYVFIGLLHAQEDFYFFLGNKDKNKFLSCVADLEQHGFKPLVSLGVKNDN